MWITHGLMVLGCIFLVVLRIWVPNHLLFLAKCPSDLEVCLLVCFKLVRFACICQCTHPHGIWDGDVGLGGMILPEWAYDVLQRRIWWQMWPPVLLCQLVGAGAGICKSCVGNNTIMDAEHVLCWCCGEKCGNFLPVLPNRGPYKVQWVFYFIL